MGNVSNKARSGAQTLAATCAARSDNLAATDGRDTGTEAVTALAHQFAGLISPLHGSFSAAESLAGCNSPIIEMKSANVGPKEDQFDPK